MHNPFVNSREIVRNSLGSAIADTADKVNLLLASGIRSIVFPVGIADAACLAINQAGGWHATVKQKDEENARIIVKQDPQQVSSDGSPYISCGMAHTQSMEHVGRACGEIVKAMALGHRAFIQPIGRLDEIVALLNASGDWRASVTHRDEDDKMEGRFVVSEVD